MASLGWESGGGRGCGGGSCGFGRRRCWGSVRPYFSMSLCRLGFRIGGFGCMILTMVILYYQLLTSQDSYNTLTP
ncbi:hypothetical protein L195_g051162 [Trifolium pratense]|uniref:Uncharacterized protein n=1 Tax=Trifolium pratense TaxID=57577 RepID=A0A2K3JY02_TRIPR|nr:hypothetical protein L195_g051162 [Trifolium pratense]